MFQNFGDSWKYGSVMESPDLVSVPRRVSRPVFWSLGLEGLVSVSKDFGLGLVLFV